MFCDRIWLNARLATLAIGPPGAGRSAGRDRGLSRHRASCMRVRLTMLLRICEASERIDCAGRWITPGLIDCHTHLIHAGDRSHEFELRLRGSSYDEIARAGGGILSTMRATRCASEEALVDSALPAVRRSDRRGRDHGRSEVRLRSRRRHRAQATASRAALAQRRAVTIVTTFLGAACLPARGRERRRLHRSGLHRDDSRRGGRGPGGDGGCIL